MLHRTGHPGAGSTERIDQTITSKPAVSPVAAVTPFTTVDMPGCVAAVLYMQGCPYRCPYCHNPQFQSLGSGSYSYDELNQFLKERSGFLEGLVFSGGEPLMDPDAVIRIGRMAEACGYRLALHTTGYAPDRLSVILGQLPISCVGLDLKGAPDDLSVSTGVAGTTLSTFAESLNRLRSREIRTEVRTTIHAELADEKALDRLVGTLKEHEIDRPVWQIQAVDGRPDPMLKGRVEFYLQDRQLTSWISVR